MADQTLREKYEEHYNQVRESNNKGALYGLRATDWMDEALAARNLISAIRQQEAEREAREDHPHRKPREDILP